MTIVFVPSLIALLLSKADEKGSPLTELEVLVIRDIDPENCWAEWLAFMSEG